ncbi:MAG: PASTA domain-containing protein [Muribaculaceae bacterium]|nr:PASTA domain-containing protein [Muribaculaceae bacterium]
MRKVKDFFVKLYKGHPVLSNVVLIILTGVILAWGSLWFLDIWTHHGQTSVVPEIKGMNIDKAKEVVADARLTIEISDSIYKGPEQAGEILESWPKGGAVVKRGRPVYVTIASFSPDKVVITSPLEYMSARQAESILRTYGITNIRRMSVPGDYPDMVVRALVDGNPLHVGSKVAVTATVVLEVSQGAPDSVSPYAEADSTEQITEVEYNSIDEAVDDVFDSSDNNAYE